MKGFIKNNIKVFIAIIITTLIVGSVSVYAASQYFAKDISFTPTNENFKKENGEPIENVEDALNELYNTKKDFIKLKDFQLNTTASNASTTIDCSNYTYYNKLTEDNFYLIYNGISPALSGSNTVPNSTVYIEKSYDKNSGILTIIHPTEKYNGVGGWIQLSVYLYY